MRDKMIPEGRKDSDKIKTVRQVSLEYRRTVISAPNSRDLGILQRGRPPEATDVQEPEGFRRVLFHLPVEEERLCNEGHP
jgi:hypothetical protein